MNTLTPFLAVAFVIALGAFFGIRSLRRKTRRKKLMELPWPDNWEQLLRQKVPIYNRLPERFKKELHGKIRVFLDEKPFEGCAGLKVTEDMRVIIAAQACILLLNRPANFYPKLDVILVYPSVFVAKAVEQQGWGAFVEKEQARLGESWHSGIVVLAWDSVAHGARDIHDGHNVVLHEFAHQLDQEDGRSDGAPLLEKGSQYVSWARHLGSVYTELQEAVAKHQPTFIDQYGATNPAEFFAVVTETFFEKGAGLKKRMPELYEELREYYQLDPAVWG